MALDPRALAKVIEIINSREKGGEPVKEYKGGVSKTPTGRSNAFSYGSGLEDYMKEAQEKGLDVSNLKSAEDLQGRIYDSLMSSREGQGVLQNMWRNYGDTLKGSGKVLPENITPQDLAGLRSSFADNMLGARTQMVLAGLKPKTPQIPFNPSDPSGEVPYEDPRSKYIVQGRLPSGMETIYYPKTMQDWQSATEPLGVQFQNQSFGRDGEQGATANYFRNPGQIAEMLKNDPSRMASLGEAYVRDTEDKSGKNKLLKLSEAEKMWNEQLRSKMMKSGFSGPELEKAMQREMTRNPYRSK
jgi:hypothetical protein